MDENQISDSTSLANDNVGTDPVQAQDKLFTRDQLAKAVAIESAKAASKAKAELESKYQRDMAELSALRANQQQNNANNSRDDESNAIYQKVQERFNQEMQK